MLKTVSRQQTLAVKAQQQLEQLIVERSYKPGDRLPSENDMGQMLGVSRTVVREAVQLLSAKGLVEARTGSGIYVKGPDSRTMQEPMSLLLRSQYITPANLIEVREMMEVRVAGLAAERATPEHIERMERALIVLRKARPTVGEVVQADLDFHNELAAATGNPLFSVLSHSMNAVMANLHAGAFRLDSVGAVQGSLLYHSRILDAIKKRDAVEARRTMEEHLADSAGWARRVAESQKGTIAPKADELLAANGTDGDS